MSGAHRQRPGSVLGHDRGSGGCGCTRPGKGRGTLQALGAGRLLSRGHDRGVVWEEQLRGRARGGLQLCGRAGRRSNEHGLLVAGRRSNEHGLLVAAANASASGDGTRQSGSCAAGPWQMRSTLKSVDFEESGGASAMWVGLAQSREGHRAKTGLPETEFGLRTMAESPGLSFQPGLPWEPDSHLRRPLSPECPACPLALQSPGPKIL